MAPQFYVGLRRALVRVPERRLGSRRSRATAAGLAVLVEAHDEAELERAVAIGAELIGVNNRDLKTFKVDLATTERLAAKLFGGTGVSPVRSRTETHGPDARVTWNA